MEEWSIASTTQRLKSLPLVNASRYGTDDAAKNQGEIVNATWEGRFETWAQGPSQTESDKIDHAITAVLKALAADAEVASVTKVFVQGSYRNRVNVRQESDVDIGVLYTGNAFFTQYPPGKSNVDFGNSTT